MPAVAGLVNLNSNLNNFTTGSVKIMVFRCLPEFHFLLQNLMFHNKKF